ncbi:DUF3870 domain-containing protein [Crassaminicella thermophila]|uniref:DUF3870 domain-containing protein n=1 Tax=Crassaminicella thermophila TaxID=2599308 RepID=A0A5C0SFU7_CRATE|nr:DUF3870 domain-containing protein [Crassaminicella thermophila]QEK13231.1 DUF3870 domain-containing protein [Crassaminicella thermophila]
MKRYSENTVYFISYAKLPTEISAANMHRVVGVGMVINIDTGIIEDTSCTLITEEARSFLKQVLVGYNLHENGIEALIKKVKYRFHGSSQKAICVAIKGTYEKYITWRNENTNK